MSALERFLELVDAAGLWAGVSPVQRVLLLRMARRDPARTEQLLDQIDELWRCARGR